jgi:hypothetical protein
MINATTLIMIAITTMHVDRQSIFAMYAPLATESTTKLGYKKSRSNGKVLCPIHSFPDLWQCICGLSALRIRPTRESQYVVDAHHAAIDNCYLSNDNRSGMDISHMGAIDDNGSVDRCLFSNSNNNIATFLAFPLPARKKKGAEGNVKCREKPAKKKRKTIAALDYDSNEKDRVYAHSILALASAKGLKEPLVFPLNSN